MVVDKFSNKNPSCVAYDDKIIFYSRIIEEVIQQASPRVSGCFLLKIN